MAVTAGNGQYAPVGKGGEALTVAPNRSVENVKSRHLPRPDSGCAASSVGHATTGMPLAGLNARPRNRLVSCPAGGTAPTHGPGTGHRPVRSPAST